MDKRQIKILIVVGALAVAVIVIGILLQSKKGYNLPWINNNTNKPSLTFTPSVPKNATLTKPAVEAPAAPGVTDKKTRTFNMTVSRSGYEPSEIVVNSGDTVNINLKTEGGDYDIYIPDIGISKTVMNGTTGALGFQIFSKGTYIFECKDHCPLLKIQGKIIVL